LFGARLQGSRIDWFATVLPAQELDEILRPRQAADVGRQNPLDAALHVISLPNLAFCVGRRRKYSVY